MKLRSLTFHIKILLVYFPIVQIVCALTSVGWMMERRKLVSGWQKELRTIRAKIALALGDLPEPVKQSVGRDTEDLNYWHCKEILEALIKSGEPQERNLFGQYQSKRMRDWMEILKRYERNNVFLGDASQILTSIVKYEIPAVGKKVERCRQQIEELSRRENENNRTIAEYMKKFAQDCNDLGIKGDDVSSELQGLVKELPFLLLEVQKVLRASDAIEQACAFYKAFVEYALNINSNKVTLVNVCATLMHVYTHANEEIEQAESEAAPIEETTKPKLEKTTSKESLKIDWGDMAAGGEETVSTNVPTEGEDATHINWDISIESEGAQSEAGSQEAPITIDWSAAEDVLDASALDIALVDSGNQLAVSPPLHKELMLENPRTRNNFITDLMELQAFLKQRLIELESKEDFSTVNQMQMSAPEIIHRQTPASLQEYLKSIGNILSALNSPRLTQILEIKNSKRYVNRLAFSVNKSVMMANTLRAAIAQSQAKKASLQESIKQTILQVEKLNRDGLTLKKNMEQSLSALFNNRKVNIVGTNLTRKNDAKNKQPS
jgi:hypothetical protein